MFNSILLPLDGSVLAECVLPHAAAIAPIYNSTITLLQMLENQTRSSHPQLFDTLHWQISKTQAQLYLQNIRNRLRNQGLDVQAYVQEGRVAEGIVVFAENQGMDLILLSSHGRSGLSSWGISSTAQKVILSAPASVLLVRAYDTAKGESPAHTYRRILVPLDGSRRAENVIPVIQRLAREQGSELYISHVVTAPEMARHLPPIPEDIDLSERIVNRNYEEAQRYLEQMTSSSSFEGISVQTRLITSENAAAALHELVEDQQIDLVVMSAHGYSGSREWPYGSMVHNFLSYGKAPLLIVQDLPAKHDLSAFTMENRERAQH